jgi:hypothetical protein
MKKIITLLLTVISLNVYSQIGTQADSVILITSGNGINEDEAVNSALRKSIEQAFGAFVSSKTEILNDSLISDKIISVSNGNIKNYKILSSVSINLNSVKVTVQSNVSINSLQSFCKNNGVVSEYEGGMFTRNLAIQKLNEENEFKAILNITETAKELSNNIWDYKMDVGSPLAEYNQWNIPITIQVYPNKNIDIMQNYLINSISGIGMSIDQVETYTKINKPVFNFLMYIDTINKEKFPYSSYDELKVVNAYGVYLRNKKSLALLQDMIYYLQYSHGNFIIQDGVDTINIVKSQNIPYKLDRKYEIKRSISYKWSFFPRRLGNKSGEAISPYNSYNTYSGVSGVYYPVNYLLLKRIIINSYNGLKRQSENYAKDAEYYKRQIAAFADSSKCFCDIGDNNIRELNNGDSDSFHALGAFRDNINLMMQINPYIYFNDKFRAKISINKIVTEDHLSKIKNIQIIPATIIDKVY